MGKYRFLLISACGLLITLLFIYIFKPKAKLFTDTKNYTSSRIMLGDTTEIMLTGDVMLGRSVMEKSFEVNDNNYPFLKVGEQLRSANIVFINLENPIIKNCQFSGSGMKFCAKPEMISGLLWSGVNVVSLANNHSGNYGKEGLLETEGYLENSGIKVAGVENALVIEGVKNVKFGFLGFDLTTKVLNNSDLNLISEAKKLTEVLLVGVHWGEEYKSNANSNQREWARKMVEAGADVIVGHHSHWIQDSEHIDGKPIYYSLGNFVFDQMWSEETKKGLVIRLTYKGKNLVKEEKLPIYMSSFSQPEFVQN